jgi:two-component sensor histidine kinase
MQLKRFLERPSLRSSLFALAVACTIPIALVAGGLVWFFTAKEFDQNERDLSDRAALALTAVELRIQNVIEDLQVLAESPAVAAGDFQTFGAHMRAANPWIGGYGLVLVDRSGQLLVSTRRAPGESLPKRGNLDTQEKVFATGQPQISGLIAAAASNNFIISIEVPVRVNNEVRYVLAAGLSPEHFAEVMRKLVPPEWIGSIVDQRGMLISRVPDMGVIGQPIVSVLLEQVGKTSGRWIPIESRNGGEAYSSFLRSQQLGWTVFVAMPRELLSAGMRQSVVILTTLVLAALAISLFLARQLSRWIMRSLEALQLNVATLGQGGHLRPSAKSGLREVAHMEGVLAGVSENIASARERVERERILLKATVEAMPVGVLIVGPDGGVLLANRKALAIWSTDRVETFRDFTNVTRLRLDGSRYPPAEWPVARALRHGAVTEDEEVIHVTRDGRSIRVSTSAAPVYDEAGTLIAAVAAFFDLTELRNAIQQQKLLLDEINHRVKNTLATVQSIATLTRAGSSTVEAYVEGFQERIFALARAYDLLTDNKWQGTDLRAIVGATLEPYGRADQVSIEGPPVHLPPKPTLALAAALQELATNAAKYGSLSVQQGRLEVFWSYKDQKLDLTWTESEGPGVTPPTRRGFGSRLIEEVLAREAGWTSEIKYRPSGLCCHLAVRLT